MTKTKTPDAAPAGVPHIDDHSTIRPLLAKQAELGSRRSEIEARLAELSAAGGVDDWTDDNEVMALLGRGSDEREGRAAAQEELHTLEHERDVLGKALDMLADELRKARDPVARSIAATLIPRHAELIAAQVNAASAMKLAIRAEESFRKEVEDRLGWFPTPPFCFCSHPAAGSFVESLAYWAGDIERSGYDVDVSPLGLAIHERSDQVSLPLTCCVCGSLIAAADQRAADGNETPWCSKKCLREANRKAAGTAKTGSDGNLRLALGLPVEEFV